MNAASWLEGLPPADKWRALALAHGPRIATWVLAIAPAVQAAVIVTNVTGSSGQIKGGPSPAVQVPQTPSVDVAAIAGAHLFGEPAIQAAAVDAANAPQSNLPLVLVGIIAADDPQDGLAILGENPAGGKAYAVRTPLPAPPN